MFAAFTRFGFQSATFSAFDHTGLNTQNETGSSFVAPPFSGRIQKLYIFFAGDGQTVTARCVAWIANGAVIAKSPKFTAPSGTETTGGQTLNAQGTDGISQLTGSDQSLQLGFWRDAALSGVWSVLATGNFQVKTETSGDVGNFSGPTNCGAPFTCGDIQAYADLFGGDQKAVWRNYPAFIKNRKG